MQYINRQVVAGHYKGLGANLAAQVLPSKEDKYNSQV